MTVDTLSAANSTRCNALEEAFRLLDRLHEAWITPPGDDLEGQLSRLEERVGGSLPRGFRFFLSRFGSARVDSVSGYAGYQKYVAELSEEKRPKGEVAQEPRVRRPPEIALAQLFGIGCADDHPRSLLGLLNRLDQAAGAQDDVKREGTRSQIRRPAGVVPFQSIVSNVFLCLMVGDQSSTPVYIWDFREGREPCLAKVADDYCAYLSDLVQECEWRIQALTQFDVAVKAFEKRFGFTHDKGGTLPRNHNWRPYRFCVADQYMGLTSCRHSRQSNSLEVNVFVTADVLGREHGAGARWLILSLLADAYRSGGSMEIRFLGTVQDGRIPLEVRELAQLQGVELRESDRILPSEARQLLMRLTGISPTLRQFLSDGDEPLARMSEAVCYAVLNNVWSPIEVEAIARGCDSGARILRGGASPEHRTAFAVDLAHTAGAVLLGQFVRAFSAPEPANSEVEDGFVPLQANFLLECFGCAIDSPRTVEVPWVVQSPSGDGTAPASGPGDKNTFLVRARNAQQLAKWLPIDIENAASFSTSGAVYVLTPADFHNLPEGVRTQAEQLARSRGVGLAVAPDRLQTLRDEAQRRLARTRMTRS